VLLGGSNSSVRYTHLVLTDAAAQPSGEASPAEVRRPATRDIRRRWVLAGGRWSAGDTPRPPRCGPSLA
jgi:hypothetical protein